MQPIHNNTCPGPMTIKIRAKFSLLNYSLKKNRYKPKISLALPPKSKFTTELAQKNSISPNTSQLKTIMKNRILRQFRRIRKKFNMASQTTKAECKKGRKIVSFYKHLQSKSS